MNKYIVTYMNEETRRLKTKTIEANYFQDIYKSEFVEFWKDICEKKKFLWFKSSQVTIGKIFIFSIKKYDLISIEKVVENEKV